jgi:cell division transport system permease protein
MRLVGASAFNIELPFVLETSIATVVGSVLAIGVLWALVRYGLSYVGSRLPINLITTADLWVVTPWLVGAAAAVASLTAWLTLRRYLKV